MKLETSCMRRAHGLGTGTTYLSVREAADQAAASSASSRDRASSRRVAGRRWRSSRSRIDKMPH